MIPSMQHRQINFVHREQPTRPKKKHTKRVAIFVLGALLLYFVTGTIVRFVHKATDDPLAYDPVTLEPKQPKSLLKKISYFVFNQGNEKLAGEKDDRINILLLGMGGIGHDGPFLTDTIMIMSIQPSEKEVALISIPRDLGIKIPGYKGIRKINHANAYGESEKSGWGGAFATEVFEKTFNIDIPYYIRLDFKAFQEIIDEVNGISVNVERTFTDSSYPADNEEYQVVHFDRGVQTMKGYRALQFARSRHGNNGEGSDFARAHRQQKILLALKEKLLSFGTLANPVRINKVINALERHMTTNMEFAEIVSLTKLAKEFDTNEIRTLVLDNSTGGFLQNAFTTNGAFILEPTAGNFKTINKAIEHIFDEDYVVVQDTTPVQEKPKHTEAHIEVQNATWKAGLAARIKKRLTDKSFMVHAIGNAAEKPIEQSGIYNISGIDAHDTMLALQDELRIPIKKEPPSGTAATSTTDILIILGENLVEQY